MASKDTPRALTEEELIVWRRVARTARPLPGRTLPAEPKEPPPSAPPVRMSAKTAPAAPPAPSPKRPVAPPEISGEKRVRRGKLEIDATLDLHGMTQAQARAALGRFVAQQRARGARVVIVVTGKGRAGEGALRRLAPDWLREEAAHVSGYAEAHQRHGGAGALYVRLRKAD